MAVKKRKEKLNRESEPKVTEPKIVTKKPNNEKKEKEIEGAVPIEKKRKVGVIVEEEKSPSEIHWRNLSIRV